MSNLSLAAWILIVSFTPSLLYAVALVRLQKDLRARERSGTRPDWNKP